MIGGDRTLTAAFTAQRAEPLHHDHHSHLRSSPSWNRTNITGFKGRITATDDLETEWPIFVELPQTDADHGWLAAADVAAEAGLRLKFRTGGLEAAAFPSAEVLAGWIDAALDRETPFKCTAGLHHAVRHTDPATGFVHHGFLNVLAATRTALDGGDVEAVLSEQDADALVAALPDADTLARTRRWFTSFGSCSVSDPRDDLVALGLISPDLVPDTEESSS